MEHNIFIIGSKGIPANYGGFETFVENLTKYKKTTTIQYHVACLSNNNSEFFYNGAKCFNIKVPNIGAAKAVYYDLSALRKVVKQIKKNQIYNNSVVYILACRIGPFMSYYKHKLKKKNCFLYVNPDGHEWKRTKWSKPIQKYWKFSEKKMVKNADLLVCDSKNIENYILKEYRTFLPKTVFIPYGSDFKKKGKNSESIEWREWSGKNRIRKHEYYLIVGRFVSENNYEIIITEFMKTLTNKDLVIITNIENNKFYKNLYYETNFYKDKRIKFVGTVYNQELLAEIRENAYAYIHGHEVGGTNPSLLEALASTSLNLLLDVGFNREVAKNGALYWNKNCNNLKELINKVDMMIDKEIDEIGLIAKKRIEMDYNWKNVIEKYENIFVTI
ncbi:beta 1-4 rhamnosyltransferase Cps2T [Eubacterium maltosivorans]|uniref:beta 1-4 rhamnosyltransferase Cps2T n=1 Tax=Eubacterium maltosivorans TaxID=2041044 RepID=UPI0018A0BFC8|nr:DUF1972 domain-containing protein [Eubacterium maltosivorans]